MSRIRLNGWNYKKLWLCEIKWQDTNVYKHSPPWLFRMYPNYKDYLRFWGYNLGLLVEKLQGVRGGGGSWYNGYTDCLPCRSLRARPRSCIQISKRLNAHSWRFSIVTLWPRGSANGLKPPGFGLYAQWAVSSDSPHHPQEVLLVEFNMYVHSDDLKPHSFISIPRKIFKFSPIWSCNPQPQMAENYFVYGVAVFNPFSAGIIFRLQILTSKDDPRTEGIKHL